MNLNALASRAYHMMSPEQLLQVVALVAQHDRFQASRGINAAADLVCQLAQDLGVTAEIRHHQADGARRWWNFQAPLSWTPVAGRLRVHDGRETLLDLAHDRDPYLLAAYSEATPGPISVPLFAHDGEDRSAGGVLLHDGPITGDRLGQLSNDGVLGLLTCPGAGVHRRRVELPQGTGIFAFSLTRAELARVRRAGPQARASVEVAIDRTAQMPVVSALVSGRTPGEVWIVAHLCHPRPGANDNASGVAAALGALQAVHQISRALAPGGNHRSIRVVWGPEFVGSAAALHEALAGGREPPRAVINLDVVGTDQSRWALPLLVERPIDRWLPQLAPLTDRVAEAVWALGTRHAGSWSSAPFAGFSDHLVFADRPTIHLGHSPDPDNHSAGDTAGTVSPVEMVRASTMAAALAVVLAGIVPGTLSGQWRANWLQSELARAGSVASTHRDHDGGTWSRGFERHMRDLLSPDRRMNPQAAHSQALARGMPGPLNVRALLGGLPHSQRQEVETLLIADRGNLAAINCLGLMVDGTKDPDAVIQSASFALRRPLPQDRAEVLLAALLNSGWAVPVGGRS